MVETDDACASTHTLRCTLARGHDGPHTSFRTRVSWTGDVDATARLRTALEAITDAMRFVLAFYDPHQRHLDTEAWKLAEAGARRSFADAEAALAADKLLSPLRSTPQDGMTDDEQFRYENPHYDENLRAAKERGMPIVDASGTKTKHRDRLLRAAVALLERNGHTGTIVGDLDYLEAVDGILGTPSDERSCASPSPVTDGPIGSSRPKPKGSKR